MVSLQSPNILVTGATGFIGKHVVNLLLERDCSVTIVARPSSKKFGIPKNRSVKQITTDDLFSESALWWHTTLKDVDLVIHLAWYVNHLDYLSSSENLKCLEGSINLARGAVLAGVERIVAVGTCLEYAVLAKPISIVDPLEPKSIYAASKSALFSFLTSYLQENEVSFCWPRLFFIHGEGEQPTKLHSYLKRCIDNDQHIELRNANWELDFIEVVEAAREMVETALGTQQGPYNICSGTVISPLEIARDLAAMCNKEYLLRKEDFIGLDKSAIRIQGIPGNKK